MTEPVKPPVPSATPASGALILVVDDEWEIRATLCELLEDEGYTVAQASNGSEALALLERGPLPAVILLDLMMPVMDGAAFRQRQLEVPRWAAIPVIILSASGGIAEKARQLAVASFLQKPMDVERLFAVLRRFIRGEVP